MPKNAQTVDPYYGLKPGSRGWFWYKRFENALLFLVPVITLSGAIGDFIDPSVMGVLTDAQTKAVGGNYEYSPDVPSEVTSVVVSLADPTILDRIIIAAPSLVFTAVVVYVCYALWRIQINLTGGGRPYTEKDAKIFGRSSWILMAGFLAAIALSIASGLWFRSGTGGLNPNFLQANGLALGILLMFGTAKSMYLKGRRSYEELEKGV